MPKIALFDIETAPNLSYAWGKYEQNIIEEEIPWYILSFAYKWLGESKVKTFALPDYPTYKKRTEDDAALCKELWNVFDEADILIAHNGDRFDIKKANARFLSHGFKPPSTYKAIDTLKIARKHFRFDSNRLNDLGRYLKVGRKLPNTGKDLWLGCIKADPKAWRIMRQYNARDVELLERVYLKLRPWASGHPNLNLYSRGDNCPKCLSPRMQRRGVLVTVARRYQRWQCGDCGAWTRGTLIL